MEEFSKKQKAEKEREKRIEILVWAFMIVALLLTSNHIFSVWN